MIKYTSGWLLAMSAAYDTYDYPSYWVGRSYEHQAEVSALENFLNEIPNINTLLEIGAGYGRLVPAYLHRAKKVILSDPSAKLLSLAHKFHKDKKIKFIHSKVENLKGKVKTGSVDVVLVVRVLHHIKQVDQCVAIISKLLKNNGYLILEFPNKSHWKAMFLAFLRGNFTYPLEIFPMEVKGKQKQKCVLPFKNYHPYMVKASLKKHGFEIIDCRSVSNFRNSFIKKLLPTSFLVYLSSLVQKPLAKISFGPSIFILARKRAI